jgi:predicted aspartyl protease
MRVMLALLLLSGVLLVSGRVHAETLPTIADIETRASAAAGPKPENYRETVVGTGSLGTTTTVSYRIGANSRETVDRGGLHTESGKYQGQRWSQNANGLTTAIYDDAGAETPDNITKAVTHVSTPVDTYVVSSLNERNAGSRLYYDSHTFYLLRREDVSSLGDVTTVYDDVQKYGARTLARGWTVSSKDLRMHYDRTEYAAGEATPDDVREPATRRQLVEFPPGVTNVVLPAGLSRNYFLVRVQIGSRKLTFLLDSGTSVIFLDTDVAKALHLELVNKSNSVAAGQFTAYAAIVPEMQIGALRMHNIAVTVGPMTTGSGIDGLLGFDFLAQLGVTLDYPHDRVTVAPADSYTPPTTPPAVALDLRLNNEVPMTTLNVDGAVAERMMLDTGWDGNVSFFDYFVRRYPQLFRNRIGSRLSFGVGGAVPLDGYVFHNVAIGAIEITNLVGTRVAPSASFSYAMDGVIGDSLLSGFVLDLDYTHARAYLTPSDENLRMRPAH